ncbi:MAG: aminotransferase class I/II-fold pyridoxal phosphate-dependent enzyme [Phycisphaeraceae bacterium]
MDDVMLDYERFISDRVRGIDASGIRRVFDLAAKLERPINLSIGQPDFDVPGPVKDAACVAIQQGVNRYTQTQGMAELREKITQGLAGEFPQTLGRGDAGLLVTSGVSGGLMLALLTCVQQGDEVLIPDPYFVMYRHLVTLAGATPVFVDTYADFELTAERIEPHITQRTKLLLFNSPSNPTGVVASEVACREIAALAAKHNVLILSDEIYDEFWYPAPATPATPAMTSAPTSEIRNPKSEIPPRLPSPAAYSADVLLLRGFSKTYGMTGWRLGYAAGPAAIVEQMTKLQQYSFVCAPSMAQVAGSVALDVDMSEHVAAYRRKRDRVVERLSAHYELAVPGGAFYAFVKVPQRLGLTATQFVERAVERGLLIIPGSVFSERDTHFRLSYACDDAMLEEGLGMLVELARG